MCRSVAKFAAFIFCMSRLLMSAHADTPNSGAIAAALTDPRRPIEQVKLDAARRPAQLVAFARLKPGYKIADFMPGNGYFTRIMADVVGPEGHVYAFLPSEQLANCSPAEVAGSKALERGSGYENVTVLSDAVANFTAPRKLDLIWTAQNYHDLHDSFMGPANVAELNKAFFDSLRRGGVLLVIDHVAQAGSRSRDTESLHRIDPAQLRKEIEAAGFVFEAQSDALRNRSDDHTLSIFDPRVRGRTDQIVYMFRKPWR
jgi:predicted methyltransferase